VKTDKERRSAINADVSEVVRTTVRKSTEKTALSETNQKKLLEAITKAVNEVLVNYLHTLENTVERLAKTVERQAERIDSLEQYTRRNALRVYGVPEPEKGQREDTDKVLCEVFRQKMGVEVTAGEICRSHRLTSRQPHNQRRDETGDGGRAYPRPIIVKFSSYNVRRSVFRQKRKLKGSGIVIREDLTARNVKALKMAQKKFGNTNVWSLDGRIFYTDPVTKKKQRYIEGGSPGANTSKDSIDYSQVD
jgi:hypothetical protein